MERPDNPARGGASQPFITSSKLEYEDAIVRIVARDGLVAAGWFDAPTMLQMRALDRVMTQARRRHASLCFVNVIIEGTPRFSKEVSDEAERQTRTADGIDAATVHLILVGGLVGAAVRAFMSTVMLVSRPKSPTKVMSDRDQAARYLVGYLNATKHRVWTDADVLALIDAACARERAVTAP